MQFIFLFALLFCGALTAAHDDNDCPSPVRTDVVMTPVFDTFKYPDVPFTASLAHVTGSNTLYREASCSATSGEQMWFTYGPSALEATHIGARGSATFSLEVRCPIDGAYTTGTCTKVEVYDGTTTTETSSYISLEKWHVVVVETGTATSLGSTSTSSTGAGAMAAATRTPYVDAAQAQQPLNWQG